MTEATIGVSEKTKNEFERVRRWLANKRGKAFTQNQAVRALMYALYKNNPALQEFIQNLPKEDNNDTK